MDASPPWYRFRDLTRSVQFAALNIAPLLTFFLFAFGVGARKTSRRKSSPGWARTAERAFQATGATAVATAILFVVLWQIV